MKTKKVVILSFLIAIFASVCFLMFDFISSPNKELIIENQVSQSTIISSDDMIGENQCIAESENYTITNGLTIKILTERYDPINGSYYEYSTDGGTVKYYYDSDFGSVDANGTTCIGSWCNQITDNGKNWVNVGLSQTSVSLKYQTFILAGSITTSGGKITNYSSSLPSGVEYYTSGCGKPDGNPTLYPYQFRFSSDQTVYFIARINKCTISFEPNNSSYGSVSTSSVTVGYGTTVSVSGNVLSIGGKNITATPQSIRYYFIDWTYSSTVTQTTTFKANFGQAYEITVTVDTTDYYGFVNDASTVYFYAAPGVTYTSNGATLTINTGTSQTCTATPYNDTSTYDYEFDFWSSSSGTINSNITIYAHFSCEQIKYKVTYDYWTNGGTSTTASTCYLSCGDSINLNYTAYKAGWTFIGWDTYSTGHTGWFSYVMPERDIIFYAIFKKEITDTFYQLGSTSCETKTTTIYNTATSGNITAPTISTYGEFSNVIGWGTSATATSTSWASGGQQSSSGGGTYYAICSKDLTLSYNANGETATNMPTTQTEKRYATATGNTSVNYSGANFTVSNDIPTCNGLVFQRWNSQADGNGQDYAKGATISNATENILLYAVWRTQGFITLNKYTASTTYPISNTEVNVVSHHGGTLSCSSNDINIATATITQAGLITIIPQAITTNGITTKIIVKCSETEVYAEATAEINVTVYLGTILNSEVTSSGYSGEYDGYYHTISVSCTIPGTTINYGTTEEDCTFNQIPIKDICTNKKIYFEISKPGYNVYKGYETITITPATFTPSVVIEGTLEYEQTLTANVIITDKKNNADTPSLITYTWYSNTTNEISGGTQLQSSTANTFNLNVDGLIGKYIYVVAEIVMANYNDNSCSAITSSTIGKASVNIIFEQTKNIVYKTQETISLTGSHIESVNLELDDADKHYLKTTYLSGGANGGTIKLECLAVENKSTPITLTIAVTLNENYSVGSSPNTIQVYLQKATLSAPDVVIYPSGFVAWADVTSNDEEEGVFYEISFDGTNYVSGTSGTNYNTEITASSGDRYVYVRAIDTLGNYNSPSTSGSDNVMVYSLNLSYTLSHNQGEEFNTSYYDSYIAFSGNKNYIETSSVDFSININTNDILGWTEFGYWENESSNKLYTKAQHINSITSDMTFVAHLKLDEIIVLFEREKFDEEFIGSEIQSQIIVRNHTIQKPVVDENVFGWEFFAWYKENARENSWNFSSTLGNLTQQGFQNVGYNIDKSLPTITLYAHWEPVEFYVTYYGVDLTNEKTLSNPLVGNPSQITLKSSFELLDATVNGYDFVAWYTDETCQSTAITHLDKNIIPLADEDKQIFLYAGLEATTFDIKYCSNDGLELEITKSKYFDKAYTIEDCSFDAPTGKVFDSWNTKIDGSGTKYLPDEIYSINDDIELFAQWANITYEIIFHTNADSDTTFTAVKTYGIDFDMPGCELVDILTNTFKITNTSSCIFIESTNFAAPNWKHFVKWNTSFDANGDDFTSGQKYTDNQTQDFYAIWDYNDFCFEFNGNDATSGSMSDFKVTYGTNATLPANQFLKTGYTFDGWSLSLNGTKAFENSEEITNFSLFDITEHNGTITLFAKWKAIEYTISFNAGEGSGNMANETFTYDIAKTLPKCDFEKEYYQFSKWETELNGVKTYFNDEEEILNLTTQSETLNFVALWLPNEYNVQFVLYDSVLWSGKPILPSWANNYTVPTTYTYTQGLTLPTSSNVVCAGYTFLGWFDNLDNKILSIATTDYGNKTLYAKWQANTNTKFTVEYYCQDTNLIKNLAYYVLHSKDTENFCGTTDTQSTITAKNITGFTAQTITQQNIKGDGSTVVKVYYDRNQYNINLDQNGGIYNLGFIEPQTYYYGINVLPTQDDIQKTGYTFGGWYDTTYDIEICSTDDMTGDLSLILHWTPNTNTTYKTEHYFEKTDGTFEIDSSKTETYNNGTTDSVVNANILSGNDLTVGFEFDSENPQNIISGNVAPDGTLVLKVYYSRIIYDITWIDGNGDTLKTDDVKFGILPVYNGDTPTKNSTITKTYTFNNTWAPNIVVATENTSYTAQFTENTRQYLVQFELSNTDFGTLSEVNINVDYGTVITASNNKIIIGTNEIIANPKTATAEYSYNFVKWTLNSNTFTSLTLESDIILIAEIEQVKNKYAVNIENGDYITSYYLSTTENALNGQISGSLFEYGQKVYGFIKINANTAEYSYSVIGANKLENEDLTYCLGFIIVSNTNNSFSAKNKVTRTLNYYDVEIVVQNEDCGHVDTNKLLNIPYDENIIIDGLQLTIGENIINAIPNQSNNQYLYEFSDWETDKTFVDGNIQIKAIFQKTLKTYTVIWKNGELVLKTDENIAYGTTPVFNGQTPTKEPTEFFQYNFSGWDPEIDENTTITGDISYYAQFEESVRYYNLTLIVNGGEYYNSYTAPTSYSWQDDLYLPNANQIKKDGYYLVGWAISNSSLNEDYITYIPEHTTGDKTYYAFWKQKTSNVPSFEFKINYNTNYNLTGLFINASVASGKVLLLVKEGIKTVFSMEFNTTATKQISGYPKIVFGVYKDIDIPSGNIQQSNIKNIATVFDFKFQSNIVFDKGYVDINYLYKTSLANGQKVLVYYVDEQGNKTYVNSTYNDNKIAFSISHFSSYVIALSEIEDVGDDSNSIVYIILGSLIIIIVLTTIFMVIKNKNNKFKNK